ncbi:MAG: hypothetical protein Q4C53_05760 [Clostridia bacterium]|nr:hypothetical protein [Clostridia bacterium]
MDNEALLAALLEKLRKLPKGEVTTTTRLMKALGCTDRNAFETIDVHMALLEAAKREGLHLEYTVDDDVITGLPQNIPFTVKRPRRRWA